MATRKITHKKVTSLDEIRAQAEPQIVEIPGFREGTTINVRLRMIDLTPRLMELKVGNPLLVEAQKLAADGVPKEEIATRLDSSEISMEILPLLDEVAKEALVEPTYADIIAIHPLTLAQKLKILDYATGVDDLVPFRGKQRLRATRNHRVPVADTAVELLPASDLPTEVHAG